MFDVDIKILLILIPAMPLLATLVTAALGKPFLRGWSHLPTVVALAVSFVASLMLVAQVEKRSEHSEDTAQVGYEEVVNLWTWATLGTADSSTAELAEEPGRSFPIEIALRADPLTAMMLATVTLIAMLVAIYSIGYMHGAPGYWRFFTYIPLFAFPMTMLVSVSNFVLLYVFWEAVGLCSYLLIGFWFEKPEAAAAGKKAFLVNRIGDFGFALGVFFIWTTYGTLNFHDTVVGDTVVSIGVLGQTMLSRPELYVGGAIGTAICLLLLAGACGKSAQFPLHVWLPDAMEGPTPVSALIHAATMVTAGVYMIARCAPLYMASPDAQKVVAVVGGFTALLAALIALTQTDLKRILAYSTISQLGYMFLGLGAGTLLGVTAAMFHLFTHAFFKALLFLGAGSVMHAMGNVIDIRQFGGLRRLMPVTHWTFLFGCLALAGVVPFAGFWSKDLILAAHAEASASTAHWLYELLYWMALVTALLTAFYTFRAYFCTFFGKERVPAEAGDHAHESPRTMTWPLVVLALCSLVVGAYFEFTHGFAHFLQKTPSLAFMAAEEAHEAVDVSHTAIMVLSTVVALAGVILAALLYASEGGLLRRLTTSMARAGLYQLSHGKFFLDEIYHALVIRPVQAFAALCYWVDRWIIDGSVNVCGLLPPTLGTLLRPLQTGMIHFYALAMVLGLLALIGALYM